MEETIRQKLVRPQSKQVEKLAAAGRAGELELEEPADEGVFEDKEEMGWYEEENNEELSGKEEEKGLGQGAADEEGENPAKVRVKSDIKVSKQEREDHELTHCSFQWWCRHCVRARGRNKAHRRQRRTEKDKAKEVPRVSMDYFFMSAEDEEAKNNPLLVMVDEKTGEKYARAVGRKGIGSGGDMM